MPLSAFVSSVDPFGVRCSQHIRCAITRIGPFLPSFVSKDSSFQMPSSFWLGRHSRTPKNAHDGQLPGRNQPIDWPDVHFKSGGGGEEEDPSTDLKLLQEKEAS